MDFLNEAQENYEQDINVLQTIQTDTTQPTGFVNRTSSMLMISTRDFSVTPTATSFDIYSAGQKYSKTASTTTIDNTKGLHYIYFDSSGNLQHSMSEWDIESANVPVSSVFWNGTSGVIHDERHSCKRNTSWHRWAHDTVGTRYETGLVGTFSTSATSFTGGTIHDEDLEIVIGAQSGTCVRVWYHDTGAATMIFDATTVATTAKIVGGVLKYDNNGTLTTVTNNNYTTNWIYASNEIDNPIYCITGQVDGTLAAARSVGLPNLANMPSKELKLLYKVIWRNAGGTPTYIESSDFRMSATLPAGGTASTNASSVIFTASGNIASTNVQTAIQELDDEKQVNLVSGTNITVNGSSINTVQDITTSSTPTFNNVIVSSTTASKAVVTDADKKLSSSTTTSTELEYLSGTNRAIQAGIDWTIQSTTPVADSVWNSVCYGNGLYVAVSQSGYRVMTSPDGINWIDRTPAANNSWNSVCYGNGLFVAVSYTGTGNRVMTSPDGITWTSRTSAADNDWYSVCYGNGLFVAIAYTGVSTNDQVMTSPDGIVWTIRASAADTGWQSVCYGNGKFVAVGRTGSGNRVMTSTDGITWTIGSGITDNEWFSVCYGNGLFVATSITGTVNRVMTSPDGIVWTTRTTNNNNWTSVTYGDGLFIAVAASGTDDRVMTSPDGITWTLRTSAANNNWNSVCYGNGLFVAVAQTGSTNGVMTSGKINITETSLNNIIHGTQTFTGSLAGNAVDRISGYAFDKELYYSTNTFLIDNCETIWTNNSVTGEVGTAALDATNFKVGLYGAQCTTSVANGGIRVSKSIDFTKFNDGSTSTTDDYICFAFYITTGNKDLLGTYGVTLTLASDVPSSVNFYYTQVTKVNTAVGWNYIKVAKKDFSSYGSPNWASILCYSVSVGSSPSGAVTFTVDAIRMERKDPSSAVPNVFQRNINGTWTRDFQIVAGSWFIGLEFGEIICRVLNIPDAISLIGTIPYTNNVILYDKIKVKYAGSALGLAYYIDVNNRIAVAITGNVLYLVIRQSGQANITPELNLTAAVNDVFEFYLKKQGVYASVVVYKNYDYNTPYTLSGSLTGGDFSSGYLGLNSYKENYEAISCTTSEHANHANVADTAKSVKNNWMSWTPTVTWTTGTPEGSVAQTARYTTIGNICYFNYSYTATDGNGATALTITLPVTAKDNNALFSLSSQQKQNATWTNPLAYIDDDSDGISFRSLSTCTDAQAVEIIVSGFYEI